MLNHRKIYLQRRQACSVYIAKQIKPRKDECLYSVWKWKVKPDPNSLEVSHKKHYALHN